MKKKTVILFTVLFQLSFTYSQTIQIKGKIVDKDTGKGIKAAHIQSITGSKKGTISNDDGNFVLNIENHVDTLIVSHIGYKTKLFLIKDNQQLLNIMMTSRMHKLSEIVIKPVKANHIIENVIKNLEDNHSIEPVYYQFYTRYIEATQDSVLHFLQEFTGKIHFKETGRLLNIGGPWTGIYIKPEKSRMGYFSERGKKTYDSQVMILSTAKGWDNIFGDVGDYLRKRRSRQFSYWLEGEVLIMQRPCFVITFNTEKNRFNPKKGKLYIDKETYAIVKKETGPYIKEFIKLNGKWYLQKVKYTIRDSNSFRERITVYNVIEKLEDKRVIDRYAFIKDPDDFEGFIPANAIMFEKAIRFTGDFDDSFWEEKSYVPLPNWIKQNIETIE